MLLVILSIRTIPSRLATPTRPADLHPYPYHFPSITCCPASLSLHTLLASISTLRPPKDPHICDTMSSSSETSDPDTEAPRTRKRRVRPSVHVQPVDDRDTQDDSDAYSSEDSGSDADAEGESEDDHETSQGEPKAQSPTRSQSETSASSDSGSQHDYISAPVEQRRVRFENEVGASSQSQEISQRAPSGRYFTINVTTGDIIFRPEAYVTRKSDFLPIDIEPDNTQHLAPGLCIMYGRARNDPNGDRAIHIKYPRDGRLPYIPLGDVVIERDPEPGLEPTYPHIVLVGQETSNPPPRFTRGISCVRLGIHRDVVQLLWQGAGGDLEALRALPDTHGNPFINFGDDDDMQLRRHDDHFWLCAPLDHPIKCTIIAKEAEEPQEVDLAQLLRATASNFLADAIITMRRTDYAWEEDGLGRRQWYLDVRIASLHLQGLTKIRSAEPPRTVQTIGRGQVASPELAQLFSLCQAVQPASQSNLTGLRRAPSAATRSSPTSWWTSGKGKRRPPALSSPMPAKRPNHGGVPATSATSPVVAKAKATASATATATGTDTAMTTATATTTVQLTQEQRISEGSTTTARNQRQTQAKLTTQAKKAQTPAKAKTAAQIKPTTQPETTTQPKTMAQSANGKIARAPGVPRYSVSGSISALGLSPPPSPSPHAPTQACPAASPLAPATPSPSASLSNSRSSSPPSRVNDDDDDDPSSASARDRESPSSPAYSAKPSPSPSPSTALVLPRASQQTRGDMRLAAPRRRRRTLQRVGYPLLWFDE